MSFAGGYDLSKLKHSDVGAPSNPGETPVANPGAPVEPKKVAVPALVMDATEETLRDVLAISAEVPILIEFHADSVRVLEISEKLKRVCDAFNGAFVLVRVDAQLQQRVGQAFGVKGAPTLIAVLKGQPVPLFEGEQDEEAITKVVDRVIEVARENGVTGIAVVKDAATLEAEQLPPLHQKAFDAINAGDFHLAITTYEQAIRENPRDDLAVSGLAQVRLLQRTLETSELAKLASAPDSLEELLLWADFKLSEGMVEEAFTALLDAFESNLDDRDQIRTHLIDLFAVVEPTNPHLLTARRRLATLLY